MKLECIELGCNKLNEISRTYKIVKVMINTDSALFKAISEKAAKLSGKVNPWSGNNQGNRSADRKLIDVLAGLLSEEAWIRFLNQQLLGDPAQKTEFVSASNQIDIILYEAYLCEVRSSFARNGVNFALCNEKYNFKNIGPYSNDIKPGEPDKHLYMGAIFEGDKDTLQKNDSITFYLVGSSTWEMMMEKGINTELIAYHGDVSKDGNYRVVYYRDTLDPYQLIDFINEKWK